MSLAFILNPAPSEPSPPPSHASSGSLSPPNTTLTDEAALDRQLTESQRFTRLPNNSTRSRARRDHVNFPPFENLTESALREVRRFGIQTVGRIQDSCRRIPYLAGKRDFQLRTGRDCFEVFEYDFKVPESDTTWTVMWDYKIGLVRTTPFFKCCNYSKTTSAKMLNNNPGLREISHSITGGAIKAQGYWMPYACARAVCANFCYNIAGALIPLFGPSFPADCTPPESPDFSRWIIDPAIIARSTREANRYRILYGTPPRNRPASADSSPRTPGSSMHGSNRHRSHFVDHDRHMRYRASIMDSPYTTHPDTDFEHRPRRPETPASLPSLRHMFSEVPPGLPPLRTPEARTSGYAPTSLHNTVPVYGPPRSWTAVNNQPRHQPQSQSQPQSTGPIRRFQPQTPAQNDSHLRTADPGLSAIPRSSTTAFYHTRDRYRYQPTAWEYISPEPQPPPQMQVQSQERGHPESQRQRMPPEPASLAVRTMPSPPESTRVPLPNNRNSNSSIVGSSSISSSGNKHKRNSVGTKRSFDEYEYDAAGESSQSGSPAASEQEDRETPASAASSAVITSAAIDDAQDEQQTRQHKRKGKEVEEEDDQDQKDQPSDNIVAAPASRSPSEEQDAAMALLGLRSRRGAAGEGGGGESCGVSVASDSDDDSDHHRDLRRKKRKAKSF